ncbi:MAG: Mur ligase family protein, partial [Myxococcota bacterium]|nr:Mur ligase family protein [Myxococcota bacterium]
MSRSPRGTALKSLDGKRIHVVGASGAEGTALLLYHAQKHGRPGLVAHDFSRDFRAFARSFRKTNMAWDRDEREAVLRRVRRLPVTFRLGEDYLAGIEDAEVILASQNWFNYPSNLPAIPDAVDRGARILGLVDLALDLFEGTRIGVTGSNGKSTTSALLVHLLHAGQPADRPVLQGGNDRARQVSLETLGESSEQALLVWEVSNRHLRDRSVPVDIAILTNITRNHIEDHGSWDAYREAKLRLPRALGPDGHAV